MTQPPHDCPLAICDYRTVDHDDLVPMDIVYPHFLDEAYEVRYNPSHRWFYKRDMGPEDVVLFKMYDSLASEATGSWSTILGLHKTLGHSSADSVHQYSLPAHSLRGP